MSSSPQRSLPGPLFSPTAHAARNLAQLALLVGGGLIDGRNSQVENSSSHDLASQLASAECHKDFRTFCDPNEHITFFVAERNTFLLEHQQIFALAEFVLGLLQLARHRKLVTRQKLDRCWGTPGNTGEHRTRRPVSKPRPTCAADRGPGGLAATYAAGSHPS